MDDFSDFSTLGHKNIGRYLFDFFINDNTNIILDIEDTVLEDLVLDPDKLECEFIMMVLTN